MNNRILCVNPKTQERVLLRFQYASSARLGSAGLRQRAERTDAFWRQVLHALDTESNGWGGHPGRSPGLAAQPSLRNATSRSPGGSPSQNSAQRKPPPEARGGAGRTLTRRGSPGSPATAEAPSRGGGKPDLIRTERSKGRLIRLPGSSQSPSARRGGVTAGGSHRSAEEREKGKGAFCARRARGPSCSCALGSSFAPARLEGS